MFHPSTAALRPVTTCKSPASPALPSCHPQRLHCSWRPWTIRLGIRKRLELNSVQHFCSRLNCYHVFVNKCEITDLKMQPLHLHYSFVPLAYHVLDTCLVVRNQELNRCKSNQKHHPIKSKSCSLWQKQLQFDSRTCGVCVCVFVCGSASLCVSVSLCFCVSVSLSLSLSLSLSVSQTLCLSVSVCLSLSRSFCFSVSQSVCLSVCLPVCLSACLSVCLRACVPACLRARMCFHIAASHNFSTRFCPNISLTSIEKHDLFIILKNICAKGANNNVTSCLLQCLQK